MPTLAVGIALWSFAVASVFAHGSEEAMKAYMTPYGQIEAALANDDLAAAQKAAKALPLDKDAKAIASSKNLEEARDAFKSMSKKAVGMSGDDEGYYVFQCPMVKDGYWVQTSTKCANPYQGKAMPGCGKMLDKKQATEMSEKMDMDHDMRHND